MSQDGPRLSWGYGVVRRPDLIFHNGLCSGDICRGTLGEGNGGWFRDRSINRGEVVLHGDVARWRLGVRDSRRLISIIDLPSAAIRPRCWGLLLQEATGIFVRKHFTEKGADIVDVRLQSIEVASIGQNLFAQHFKASGEAGIHQGKDAIAKAGI